MSGNMIEIPLLPHGQCLLWGSALLWLHLIADAVIATAYYSIPVTLGTLVWKRKDLPLSRIFWLFGLFILGCGTGHLLEIWTIWWPNYRAEGVV